MTDPVNRPVRLAAVAGAAAIGLLLSGCSGDGGEGGSTSASPTATEAESSSTSPGGSGSATASPNEPASASYEPATSEGPAKNVPLPEMPQAAKEPTEEGLEAAVKYWWATENYLKATGDPGPMARVSGKGCIACKDLIEDWTWVYEQDGWVVSEPAAIDVRVTNVDDVGGTFILLVTEQPGSVYRLFTIQGVGGV